MFVPYSRPSVDIPLSLPLPDDKAVLSAWGLGLGWELDRGLQIIRETWVLAQTLFLAAWLGSLCHLFPISATWVPLRSKSKGPAPHCPEV